MNEIFSKLDHGELIGFTAVAGSMLCGIIAIIGGYVMEMRKSSLNANLKQAMLERGMSAEEIKLVMDSGATKSGKKCT